MQEEQCEMDLVIALEIVSQLLPIKKDFRLEEAWQTLKTAVLAQQTTNKQRNEMPISSF